MSNKLYYKVENIEIREDDVNKLINGLGRDGHRFNSEEGKQHIASELLNQNLLYLDALENNLDKSFDFIKDLESTKKQLLSQFAIKEIIDSVEVSDEDAQNFFNQNPSHFPKQYDFHASHILVKSEEDAKKIKQSLDSGSDFSELAKSNSTCPSKEKGGDLGHFSSGQMVPEFEKALLELENNQVSEPVKTQFGYHIIKLSHKNLLKDNTFESYKNELKSSILSQKQQEAYLNKVEKLKSKFKIEKGQ